MRYLIFILCFIPTLLLAQSQGGSGVDNAFRVPYDATNYTNLTTNSSGEYVIAATGINVGINNTNPAYTLHVGDGATGPVYPAIFLDGQGTNDLRLSTGGSVTAITSTPRLDLYGSGILTATLVNGNFGINTVGADRKLDVLDASNPQFRLTYTDGSIYTDFQTDSSGYLKLLPSGKQVNINLGADSSAITDLLINPTTKTSGDLIDLQVNGASKFKVNEIGVTTVGNYFNTYNGGGIFLSNTQVYRGSNNLPIALKGGSSFTNAGSPITLGSTTFTNTSGQSYHASITAIYNQASGTASNTDLLISRTETAIGSGAQYLIDAQVDSASKFSVSNAGQVTAAAGMQAAKVTGDPCGTYPEGSIFYNDTNNYYCYCDGTNDVQLHNPAADCF